MDITFNCSSCGQALTTDSSSAGALTDCPACGSEQTIPALQTSPDHDGPAEAVIYCTQCGQKHPENSYKCTRCGKLLHGPARPQYRVSDDPMASLIPTKNSSALIGYYLGVFSLIPVLGIPLGIAAVILGIKGRSFAKLHPEAKGGGHAWTAIILGGFSSIVYSLFIIMPVILAAVS